VFEGAQKMSALNKELVLLVHQYLEEEGLKETVRM